MLRGCQEKEREKRAGACCVRWDGGGGGKKGSGCRKSRRKQQQGKRPGQRGEITEKNGPTASRGGSQMEGQNQFLCWQGRMAKKKGGVIQFPPNGQRQKVRTKGRKKQLNANSRLC